MKTIVNVILLLISSSVLAQDKMPDCLLLKEGKGAIYFRNQSKNLEKNGEYDKAAYCALRALMLADKPKKIRKGIERVHEVMPKALSATQSKGEELTTTHTTFVGEKTINGRTACYCNYEVSEQLRSLYNQIPSTHQSAKKVAPLNYQLIDFSKEKQVASDSLTSAKLQACEMYFELAKSYPRTDNRKDNLKILKTLKRARVWHKHHSGVNNMFNEIYDDAVGKIIIMPVTNKSNKSGLPTTNLRQQLITSVKNALKPPIQSLYKVLPATVDASQANISIEVVFTSASYNRENEETTNNKRAKELEGGKSISATIYEYAKNSTAQVDGSYKIKDLSTGELLATGQASGQGYFRQTWATYTGNKEALSKRDKRQLRKEPEWISEDELTKQAVGYLANKVAAEVMKYFQKEGKPVIVNTM